MVLPWPRRRRVTSPAPSSSRRYLVTWLIAAAEVVLQALVAGEAAPPLPGVGEQHGVQQLGVPGEARRVQERPGQQDEPAAQGGVGHRQRPGGRVSAPAPGCGEGPGGSPRRWGGCAEHAVSRSWRPSHRPLRRQQRPARRPLQGRRGVPKKTAQPLDRGCACCYAPSWSRDGRRSLWARPRVVVFLLFRESRVRASRPGAGLEPARASLAADAPRLLASVPS